MQGQRRDGTQQQDTTTGVSRHKDDGMFFIFSFFIYYTDYYLQVIVVDYDGPGGYILPFGGPQLGTVRRPFLKSLVSRSIGMRSASDYCFAILYLQTFLSTRCFDGLWFYYPCGSSSYQLKIIKEIYYSDNDCGFVVILTAAGK
jgi:hypothetical protein